MQTLTAGNVLQALASATGVHATVFGDLQPVGGGATDNFEPLAQSTSLPTGSPGALYTVPGSDQVVINEIELVNTNGTATSVTLYLATGTTTNLTPAVNIPANGSAIWTPTAGIVVYNSSGLPVTTGVSSVNTRTGAVTILAADIEATFTAAGQVFYGTGAGTGSLVSMTTAIEDQFTAAGQLFYGTGSGTGALLALGSANQVLAVNGAGTNINWTTGLAVAAVGSSPNADGASVSGQTLTLQPVSATQPGVMVASDYGHLPSGWYDVTRQGTNSLQTGSTAGVGAANVTALTNIMAAVPSGSVLYFPPGWYDFASTVTIPAKVFIFQGSGSGLNGALSAFTRGANAGDSTTTDWLTQTASDYYMQFRDIGFISQSVQTAGACINVNGNANNNIYNCEFTGLNATDVLFNCINFAGGANAGEESQVYGCDFTNFSGTAIICNGTLETLVIDSVTINGGLSGTTGAAAGVSVLAGGAVLLANCDVIGCTNNFLINPGSTVASVWCVNSYFDNSFGSCIKITGSSAAVRIKFEQCSFTCAASASPANAVEVSSTFAYGAVGQGLDFINCNVLNTFGSLGVGTGFNITGAADFRIMGCNIAAWATGIAVTPANSNGMTRPQIQGNTIGNAGGYGINTTGISLAAGSFQYGPILIAGNNMAGNTTPLSDASTQATSGQKIVRDNLGLVTPPNSSATTQTLVASTKTLAGNNFSFPPGSMNVGTAVRITAFLTEAATIGTITAFGYFGTTGTAASDTLVANTGSTAFGAASGVIGGGKCVLEFFIISSTTCITTLTLYNGTTPAGTTGMSNLPVQSISNTAPVTIATAAQSYLGLWLENGSTVGTVIRGVVYEVIHQ